MTQAEFEALQVGDVVASNRNYTAMAVIYETKETLTKYLVWQEDGLAGAIYHDEIEDWSVVSRVITRENVQAKGGA